MSDFLPLTHGNSTPPFTTSHLSVPGIKKHHHKCWDAFTHSLTKHFVSCKVWVSWRARNRQGTQSVNDNQSGRQTQAHPLTPAIWFPSCTFDLLTEAHDSRVVKPLGATYPLTYFFCPETGLPALESLESFHRRFWRWQAGQGLHRLGRWEAEAAPPSSSSARTQGLEMRG